MILVLGLLNNGSMIGSVFCHCPASCSRWGRVLNHGLSARSSGIGTGHCSPT